MDHYLILKVVVMELIAWLWLLAISSRLGRDALIMAANAYVLSRFSVHKEGPVYVDIKGRRPGLIAWFLTWIGFDPNTELKITRTKIEFSEGTLGGRGIHLFPLKTICNFGVAYTKPFLYVVQAFFYVVAAVFFLFLALYSVLTSTDGNSDAGTHMIYCTAFFCGAALFYWLYTLKKTLTLFFMAPSSVGAAIGFKKSIIEGLNMSEEKAQKIIDLVSKLIEQNGSSGDFVEEYENSPVEYTCPHCHERLVLPPDVASGQAVLCPNCNRRFRIA